MKIKQTQNSERGFTLIELLVVIAIIAILAAMLLPALSKAKVRAQGVYCMNNTRTILLTFHMYANDNNDVLAPNDFYSGSRTPGGIKPWFGPVKGQIDWVGGAMDNIAGNAQATNITYLTTTAAFGPYNPNANTYHCPADNSVVTGIGPRVRTYSMNSAVGTVYNNPSANFPKGSAMPVNFLDSSTWSDTLPSAYWRTFGKLASIMNASQTWVILDENPFSINDAVFAVEMAAPDANGNATASTIVDTPGSYHNGACGISFADGHSEIHQWKGSTIKITQVQSSYAAGDSLADLQWLQARTTITK